MPYHLDTVEVCLHTLRFYAHHGVLPQERTVGGNFTLDLTLTLSKAEGAVRHDLLDSTVSYAEVYTLVRQEMEKPSDLLEHAGGRILTTLFRHFDRVVGIDLRLRKDNPPIGADTAGCSVHLVAHR